MNVSTESDQVISEIKRRALEFVCDNPQIFHLQLEIESAMMIGASIVIEARKEQESVEMDVASQLCEKCKKEIQGSATT